MSPFVFSSMVQPGWISKAGDSQVSGAGLCHQGFRWSFEEFFMGFDGIHLAYFIIRTIFLSFRHILTTFKN